MQEVLNPTPEATEARAACARYLDFRIQSTREQKPSRAPDMSPAAAAAMKAVLIEVGSTPWETLKMVFESKGVAASCVGVANSHSSAARKEIVAKTLHNHFRLLQVQRTPLLIPRPHPATIHHHPASTGHLQPLRPPQRRSD